MNKIFWFRVIGIAAFIAMIAVFSVAAMLLWNALMPEIFGLHALSYWQAAGLLVLAGLIPGNALREKWMNMTDDERKDPAFFLHIPAKFFYLIPQDYEHTTHPKTPAAGRPCLGFVKTMS